MRVAVAAWRHRRAAIAALAAGDSDQALAQAMTALSLERTEETVDLAFTARLTV
jgi:hypothetical protein